VEKAIKEMRNRKVQEMMMHQRKCSSYLEKKVLKY
jgi:hypothetical protein